MTSHIESVPRRIVAPGRSCLECRRRKIKCDRSLPCAYCTRTKTQCQYPRATTSRRAAYEECTNDPASLDAIENALQTLEHHIPQIRGLIQPPFAINSHGRLETPIPRREAPDELGSLVSGVLDSQAPRRSPESVTEQLDPSLSLLLRLGSSPTSPSPHPSPATIFCLWQVYLDVVDPTLKLFHVPTVQKQIVEAVQQPQSIDSATECLMFAIYYSTIMTMSPAKCQSQFQEERADLLKRYRAGCENSLSRANLLRSRDLQVLQAFVLYLTFGNQQRNGPDVCTLLEMAIGIAMTMGLHCDGTALGLCPFQTEIRRRLWWQICTLDVRMAMDHKNDPIIIGPTFDVGFPSDANDITLDPEMQALPLNRQGKTEMLLTLVRHKASSCARRVAFSDTFCRDNNYPILNETQKCHMLAQLRTTIEKQYLTLCETGAPLDFVAVATTRLMLAKFKLAICKPRASRIGISPLKADYEKVCLEVLEQAHILRQYKKGHQWSWLFQTCVEWDALAYLLLEVCMKPSGEISVKVWPLMEDIYEYWKIDHSMVKDRRWPHIQTLWNQAHNQRQKVQLKERGSSTPTADKPAASIPDILLEATQHPLGLDTHLPAASVLGEEQQNATEETANDWEMADFSEQNPSPQNVVVAGDFYLVRNVTSDNSNLPGNDTACEWSAGCFEEFWQISGLEEAHF